MFVECPIGGDVEVYRRVGNGWEEVCRLGTDEGSSIAQDEIIDDEGRLHVVWSECINQGTPEQNWEIYHDVVEPDGI